MTLLQDLTNPIIITLVVIIAILAIIWQVEKRLRKESFKKIKYKNDYYIKQLVELNQKDPKYALEKLDILTRDFFKEAFKLYKFKGYSNLEDDFLKDKEEDIAYYCEGMAKAFYSKKRTQKLNKELTKLFLDIVKKYKITPKKPKKELFFDKIKNTLKKIEDKFKIKK